MWLCLGWFIYFQARSADLSGEENRDNEWSFGQILALATWTPILVEFAYVWYQKPVEALNGRLIDPFEVVEVSRATSAFELHRSNSGYQEV
ncbi:hypothetical protein NX059_001307 [Plenodomus lindquistii]|nr:hypothetical protein NX059_001307 [Plenodomus lindquistii]